MNKRIIFSLLLSFFVVGAISAQTKKAGEPKDGKIKERFEKFRAQRVSFITGKVNLTEQEAKAFWPLCNELQEKKFELNKPLREKRGASRAAKKEMSSKDYLEIMNLNADIKIKEAELEKEYLSKFAKVLSPEKIYKYQQAEEEFMKQFFSPNNNKRSSGNSNKRSGGDNNKQSKKSPHK